MTAAANNRVYLASRSPRRRELLAQIRIAFEELPLGDHAVDESPHAGEQPAEYVERVARAKAQAGWQLVVARRLLRLPVLAADTTVVLAGEILGKPDDDAHARWTLERLSGATHEVLTAVTVAQDTHVATALSVSTVEFRELDGAEIRRYVASGEPLDKAGAYAIQGRAAAFARAIRGSYSGIVGLPLYETARLLREFGIVPI